MSAILQIFALNSAGLSLSFKEAAITDHINTSRLGAGQRPLALPLEGKPLPSPPGRLGRGQASLKGTKVLGVNGLLGNGGRARGDITVSSREALKEFVPAEPV